MIIIVLRVLSLLRLRCRWHRHFSHSSPQMRVFFQGRASVDSWTPGLEPLCHRHPTGPLRSGLSWTPWTLVPDRGAVAPGVGAADPEAARRVDDDAVGVAGIFVPAAPAVEQVATPLQRVDRRRRHARFDVQRVARLAYREPARQEARALERLLDIAAVVDH